MKALSKTATSMLVWPLSTLAALAILFAHPFWLDAAENWIFDNLARWSVSSSEVRDVALVEIDDDSLAALGRWPWPRPHTARLIQTIASAKPAVIALDMIFPEASDQDAGLAQSFVNAPVVGGYYFGFAAAPTVHPSCLDHAVPSALAALATEGAANWFHNATTALCNTPALAALSKSGFLNASPDSDGTLRRVPLFIAHAGRLYPSFALAAVVAAQPLHQAALKRDPSGAIVASLNDHVFRLDGRGSLLPRIHPERDFLRLSAASLVNGSTDVAALRGRIVFVGLTAKGTGDVRATAIDPTYTGVAVHASVAENLLYGNALAATGFLRGWEALCILAAGALSIFALRRFSLAVSLPLCVGLAAGLMMLSSLLFVKRNLFLSPVLSVGAICGTALTAAGLQALRQRDRDRHAASELRAANDFMLAALASLTALRDVETGQHLVRVQRSLRLLCEAVCAMPRFRSYLAPETIELLVAVAPIHDIGKIGVPDSILLKRGQLTQEERDAIQQHVFYGQEVLEGARVRSGLTNRPLFEMCNSLVFSHHERWDGSGYPNGLKGDAIPLPARLLAVVDVYDALATFRVYKPAFPHELAVQEIAAGKGTQFDPEIVDAFLAHQESFRHIYDNGETGATYAAH